MSHAVYFADRSTATQRTTSGPSVSGGVTFGPSVSGGVTFGPSVSGGVTSPTLPTVSGTDSTDRSRSTTEKDFGKSFSNTKLCSLVDT